MEGSEVEKKKGKKKMKDVHGQWRKKSELGKMSHLRLMRRCHVADSFPPKVRVSQLQNGQGLSLRGHENWRFYQELSWKCDSGIHNGNAMAAERRTPWHYDLVDGDTCGENGFRAFAGCARMMNSRGRRCNLGARKEGLEAGFGKRDSRVTDRHGTLTLKCAIEQSSNDNYGKKGGESNSNYVVPLVNSSPFSNSSCITHLNKRIPDTIIKAHVLSAIPLLPPSTHVTLLRDDIWFPCYPMFHSRAKVHGSGAIGLLCYAIWEFENWKFFWVLLCLNSKEEDGVLTAA
ncbi:hypothetical protein V8G54_010552 [Vigna mungo]|uniref:Uncharacterized protein n=1 Tax=Vigna mungo TaxID=3915 RepID=A0AAQ3NX98_VIGMU